MNNIGVFNGMNTTTVLAWFSAGACVGSMFIFLLGIAIVEIKKCRKQNNKRVEDDDVSRETEITIHHNPIFDDTIVI